MKHKVIDNINTYEISQNIIPQNVYLHLRLRCGLSPKSDEAASIGLKNSLCCISIKVDSQIIGMGRLIGDGGCFCQIVDICVLPEFQGKGFGKVIVGNLIRFMNNELPESCYISLIADGEASHLYEKYGFKDTLPKSRGMYLKL